jgi:hypothetical protein
MKKEFIFSFVISLLFLTAGFWLYHSGYIGFGISFFVFLPFILGFLLGRSTLKKISLAGLIISFIIFFMLLLTNALEGMVCVLMAMPIIFIAVLFGYLAGFASKKDREIAKKNNRLTTTLLPFALFLLAGFAEKAITGNSVDVGSVKTEIVLPYTPLQVYETIKSVDTLVAEKSFLMKIGLPVPQKCILEKEAVGGMRTCYFSGGTITEKITALQKGRLLRMDVTSYKLTGRKWLGFREAIYYFEAIGKDSCKLTRETTYTSKLRPRIYWEPLEKIGIRQEHDYVFENLVSDLIKKYQRR